MCIRDRISTLSNSCPADLVATSGMGGHDAVRPTRVSANRGPAASTSADDHQRLAVFHGLSVLGQDRLDHAGTVGLDLVHQLHRLDNAKRIADLHAVADVDKGFGAGGGGAIEL